MADKMINPKFRWEPDLGKMTFEGAGSILFWTESAFKSFIETIEEISGDDAAEMVMKTAGFRMGKIVSEFFGEMGAEEVIRQIPEVYASAGWGKFEVVNYSIEDKLTTIRLVNSWEFIINKEQGKKKIGSFLPGHLAGILAGLFDTYIDYKILKSQIEGDGYDEIQYFPSEEPQNSNVHDYVRANEQLEIEKLEALVEERTRELTNLVTEISSPIIPVLDQIVVVPLLGKYDRARAEDMQNSVLKEIPTLEVSFLILDLTGIDDEIDEQLLFLLHRLTNAVSFLGVSSIIVGVTPTLSMKITNSNIDLSNLTFFSTLKHAVHFALSQQGRQIIG